MSRRRSTPLGPSARMMMSPNCSGEISRPLAVTVYTSCWPSGAGSWPILPAAFCLFWTVMAWTTSVVLMPNWAMRSGLSQPRIE